MNLSVFVPNITQETNKTSLGDKFHLCLFVRPHDPDTLSPLPVLLQVRRTQLELGSCSAAWVHGKCSLLGNPTSRLTPCESLIKRPDSGLLGNRLVQIVLTFNSSLLGNNVRSRDH